MSIKVCCVHVFGSPDRSNLKPDNETEHYRNLKCVCSCIAVEVYAF